MVKMLGTGSRVHYSDSARIADHKEAFPGHYETWFDCPEIANTAEPGNFVAVRHEYGPYLPRPFCISDIDGNCFSVLYKVVGQGTEALANYRNGDRVTVKGPLGGAVFSVDDCEDLLMVAGGIGAAALHLLAKESAVSGRNVRFLAGAHDRKSVPYLDSPDWKSLRIRFDVATDDGSYGYKGLVTDLMEETMKRERPDKAFLAGPEPMKMEAMRLLRRYDVPGEVAMEQVMACGIGACLGCVIKTRADDPERCPEGWKYSRVCSEGPVFDVSELYFD